MKTWCAFPLLVYLESLFSEVFLFDNSIALSFSSFKTYLQNPTQSVDLAVWPWDLSQIYLLVKIYVPWSSRILLCNTSFRGLFQKVENRLPVISCFFTWAPKFLFSSNLMVKYLLFPVLTIFGVVKFKNLILVNIFGLISWSTINCIESNSNVSFWYNRVCSCFRGSSKHNQGPSFVSLVLMNKFPMNILAIIMILPVCFSPFGLIQSTV